MVGSGQQEWLSKWIGSSLVSVPPSDFKARNKAFEWEGLIFSGLCEYSLRWDEPSADKGLIEFEKVVRPQPDQPDGQSVWIQTEKTIPLVQAVIALSNELRSGKYHKTSPELFDRFADYRSRFGNKGVNIMERGGLDLFHPLGPKPEKALAAFKEVENDLQPPLRSAKSVRGGHKEGGGLQHAFVRAVEHRAVTVLQDQSRHEDAD